MRVDIVIPEGVAAYQCTQGDWEITARAMNPPKPSQEWLDERGYELVECRAPRKGDTYASFDGRDAVEYFSGPDHFRYGGRRWILRKKWTPPAEFPEGWWLYHTPLTDTWWLNPREPPREPRDKSVGLTAICIKDWMPDFVPPPTHPIQVRHGN